jgi:hypothetical protein
MQRKSPYDPATAGPQVHDRRAKVVNRGLAGHLTVVEVDDPFEAGARITAARSVRGDVLADHLARGHIDEAQFEAGRAFQRCFAVAERGPRSMQLTERVDGGAPPEALTDAQAKAARWLSKCYQRLGVDGSALLHDVLIRAMSMKQIAASRGLAGPAYPRYFGMRLRECLDALAIVFGFATSEAPRQRLTARPAPPPP